MAGRKSGERGDNKGTRRVSGRRVGAAAAAFLPLRGSLPGTASGRVTGTDPRRFRRILVAMW